MRYSFRVRQREKKIENAVEQLKKVQWRYRNSIFLIISVLLAYFLLRDSRVENAILELKNLSYAGAFLSGIFFSFSLTVAPSTAILYLLGKRLNPIFIAAIGAGGCLIGDYLIFRFVKDKLIEEIKLIGEGINSHFQNSIFYRIFPFSNLLLSNKFKIIMMKASHSRIYSFFIKIIAYLIIASPLPDELGVALLGTTKQKTKEFLILSYFMNFLGISGISYLATR